ncbi:MAG: ADOP family duplicated permease [Terriglobia bacterium]
MRWITMLRLRFRSLFRRKAVDEDLEEEVRYHLERQIDEEIAQGKTPEDARYAALRSFANAEQRKEECRDRRGLNVIANFAQDFRYSMRQLRRARGFAATAIVVLALGVCASTAIFAIVDAALIQPLPYRDPSRLVGVYESEVNFERSNLSYLDYLDWKKQNTVFTSLEAYRNSGFIANTPAGAQPATAALVSAGFFHALGVTPVLGRDFRHGEDRPGASHVVMLSYATWQKRYGGKPSAIGRTVILDGSLYTVIGVLPKDFQFAPVGAVEFWAPLDGSTHCEKRRNCHNLFGIARLKPGVSLQTALADTKLIARQLEKQYPDSNRGQSANVVPLSEVLVGHIRPVLLVLLGGACLLLLIAYVNTASLLLVRSESRRHEIAIRSALGAAKVRLMQAFAIEGLPLVAGSALIGLASAHWAMQLLIRLVPQDMMAHMPFLKHLGFNTEVWVFAGATALAAAILCAVTPIVHFSWTNVRAGLMEGSRGASGNAWRRLGARLIVVELATAMVLLVGAGLLGKSLYMLLHVNLGMTPDHVATILVGTPQHDYATGQQQIALGRQIITRLSALPGVNSAAIASDLPVNGNGNTDWIRIVGRPYNGKHNEVNERDVSGNYFKVIQAKLLRGRYFIDVEDLSKPRVVIINQALAQKYFPGQDPIGKQFGDTKLSPKSIRTIIGVVDNIREGSLDSAIWPAEYIPFNQSPDSSFSLAVRTAQSPQSLLPALVASVRKINPGIVTRDEATMLERIDDSSAAYLHRSSAWLVSGFAALALLLAIIGLYGVVAYSVHQRTREIGIRMALGAQPAWIYRLILKEAAWLAVIGVAGGIVCSLAGARLIDRLLFGVHPWDLATLAAVSAILLLAAMLASYIPARRAASVNPVEALRSE